MLVDATSTISVIVPEIGRRIECSGQYGTIKYIGPVQNHPSIWLGIDWDDPERGKHNGCVNGVQYFTTRHPTSGSFVRPERVNMGQSYIKAITSRYGKKDDAVTEKVNQQQLLSFQQKMNAPFLQLVGFDGVREKQSDFNKLQVVNLRMQFVRGSANTTDLRSLCPNITELDISKNLLGNWEEVFNICSQLDYLRWLLVSENIMEMPSDISRWRFPSLQALICGKAELTWNNVLKLSQIFPYLEELIIPSNHINTLHLPDTHNFGSLKMLDLENNQIGSWKEINKLGKLPLLEQLLLENIGIDTISFPTNQYGKTDYFYQLKKLVLSDNKISDWAYIGELNKLRSLTELRLVKNSVLETENYNTCVQLIIARIGNLKMLNGSKILPDERKGAEYDYLKKYCLEWLAIKNSDQENEFIKRHSRYLELLEKYGTPEEAELKKEPKIIQGSLVDVVIVFNDKTITKKLPPTLVVQKLIMMIQRLFNLPDRPSLKYISGSEDNIEILLDDEGKELGFYSIQKGDKILVQT